MSETKNTTVNNELTIPALAYLGDAVIEVCIRERLVRLGLCGSGKLNEAALHYVKATAQSEAVNNILPLLSKDEENVYKRGRNSPHIKRAPQSATLAEYRRASGMETLFGKLKLEGKTERIDELIDCAYPTLKLQ